jgi:hypothetical protein
MNHQPEVPDRELLTKENDMNDMNDTPKDALWDALDNIVTLWEMEAEETT